MDLSGHEVGGSDAFDAALEQARRPDGALDLGALEAAAISLVDAYSGRLLAADPWEDVTLEHLGSCADEGLLDIGALVDEFLEATFGEESLALEDLRDHVGVVVVESLRRPHGIADTTQLHFVGYGAAELLPGRIDVKASSAFLGRLRGSVIRNIPVCPDDIVTWHLVGLTDVAADLLRGMGFDRRCEVRALAEVMLEHSEMLPVERFEEHDGGISAYLNDFYFSHYQEPMRRFLACLSLPALAEVVDLLARAQAFRSMAVGQQVLAGGTIELLTISKADGVIWQRRVDKAASQIAASAWPL